MSRKTKPPRPSFKDRPDRTETRPYAIHRPNPDGFKHGVPKWARRYANRYGQGVDALVAMHLKFPAEKLDHWADAKRAAAKLVDALRAADGL